MNIDLQEMDMDAVQLKVNNIKKKKKNHVFVWGKINFLCRGWLNAVFWILDENSGDNTPMF